MRRKSIGTDRRPHDPDRKREEPARTARLAVALLGGLLALALVSCNLAQAEDSGPPGGTAWTGATQALADTFALEFLPAGVTGLKWELEVDYDTAGVRAVFDHYDAALVGEGFERVGSVRQTGDRLAADYHDAASGADVELEVEPDRGRVQAELEIAFGGGTATPPTGFGLAEAIGPRLVDYPGAEPVEIEWELEFFHPSTDAEAALEHYDAQLVSLGWSRLEKGPDGPGKWEAMYLKGGLKLELDAKAEAGGARLELELEWPRR